VKVAEITQAVGQGSTNLFAKAAPERRELHTMNGGPGLELATNAITMAPPPISIGSRRPVKSRLEIVLAPWNGPPAIVSRPGDEAPLPTRGKVLSVYDGDTITMEDREIKVRVQNVNAPEMKPIEEYAVEATDATKALLLNGREVGLVWDNSHAKDHYGRIIAQVVLADGSDLAEHLIEHGLGHVFIVSERGNPGNFESLLAAQARARAAGLGIWSTESYRGELSVSSFHANGYGRDKEDPNGEYFRMVNITNEPLRLAGYTVTNKAGRTFNLPDVEVRPGHTIQVFSGVGQNRLDPAMSFKLYLGSDEPVWDNFDDMLTVKNPAGGVVVTRAHKPKKGPIDLTKLGNPVTQKRVKSLGLDVESIYTGPKTFKVTGKVLVDDGDTLFIPKPRTGAFKVKLTDDKTGVSVRRDVEIADQRESPEGMLAIRLMGADTPETHVEVRKGRNKPSVWYGQGKSGQVATKKLYALLKKAKEVEIEPNDERPFDTYSRMLAVVWATMPNGTKINVNKWLVEQGLAEMSVPYTGRNHFDRDEFAGMSAAAKKAYTGRRGIYGRGAGRCEERPVDFRRRVRNVGTKPPYVADMENGIVYTGSDIDRVKPYNRLFIFQPRLRDAIATLELRRGPGVPG